MTQPFFRNARRALALTLCLTVGWVQAQENPGQLFFDGFELLKQGKAPEAVAKFE